MRFQQLNCSLLAMLVKNEVQDPSLTRGGALVGTMGIGGSASQRSRCKVSPILAWEGQVYCKPRLLNGSPQLGRGGGQGRPSGEQERTSVVTYRKYHRAGLVISAHCQQSDSQRSIPTASGAFTTLDSRLEPLRERASRGCPEATRESPLRFRVQQGSVDQL